VRRVLCCCSLLSCGRCGLLRRPAASASRVFSPVLATGGGGGKGLVSFFTRRPRVVDLEHQRMTRRAALGVRKEQRGGVRGARGRERETGEEEKRCFPSSHSLSSSSLSSSAPLPTLGARGRLHRATRPPIRSPAGPALGAAFAARRLERRTECFSPSVLSPRALSLSLWSLRAHRGPRMQDTSEDPVRGARRAPLAPRDDGGEEREREKEAGCCLSLSPKRYRLYGSLRGLGSLCREIWPSSSR